MTGAPGSAGRRWPVLWAPYAWLVAFFMLPLLIVLTISLSEGVDARPPFRPAIGWSPGEGPAWRGTLDAYRLLIGDDLYFVAFVNSVIVAGAATLGCLALGYPIAYAVARAPAHRRGVLLMLVVLPFWTSFLIRVYAWMTLLRPTGLINGALIALGAIEEPLPLMNNAFGVVVGMIYSYLPFMILPLYASIEKLDPALLEAAADLGAKPPRAFLSVTLPLTLPGIVAGSLLVFVPAVGEFVIPELLGGPDLPMIGRVLWTEFFSNRDWPTASAVAVGLLMLLALPMVLALRARPRPGGMGP